VFVALLLVVVCGNVGLLIFARSVARDGHPATVLADGPRRALRWNAGARAQQNSIGRRWAVTVNP
jgi:hypothetical protein